MANKMPPRVASLTPEVLKTMKGGEVQEQHLAVAFLLSSDQGRHGKLIKSLENDFLQGQDRCTKTIPAAAFSLLTSWKQSIAQVAKTPNNGVLFFSADKRGNKETDASLAVDATSRATARESAATRQKQRAITMVKKACAPSSVTRRDKLANKH